MELEDVQDGTSEGYVSGRLGTVKFCKYMGEK